MVPNMTLTRTVGPTETPVTLDEVKAHLQETSATKDAEVASCIAASVAVLDGEAGILNRALVSQTWQAKLDGFPACGHFDLPLPPLQSVSSIVYLDVDGNPQTLATSVYRVLNAGSELKRGRVELDYGQSWPATRNVSQAVTVTFVAGYGARNAVPEHTRRLILTMVSEMYDGRSPLVPSNTMRSPAFEALIAQCRYPAIG